MRQNSKHRQYLHPARASGEFAETSTFDRRQRRSEEVPDLRAPFSPASQGHLAAVEQVPTAAASSSVCGAIGLPPGTLVALRQDIPRDSDDLGKRLRSNRDRLRFPRRIRGTSFSFCPASQGKVAVAGPVPAAATSFDTAKKRDRAVDTLRGGRAR